MLLDCKVITSFVVVNGIFRPDRGQDDSKKLQKSEARFKYQL